LLNENESLRLVFWETTEACNLECVHCRRSGVSREVSRKDLSTQEAFRLIEGLARDFDPPPVLVLSGGEPMVRPDLFEMMRFAVEKHLRVALATNGTLITENVASEIARSGIHRVSISFDGAKKETHDSFRKMPGSFERAMAGFKSLQSFGMPMQINATVTRHNVQEVEEIFRMALELQAKSLHYFLLVPVGCGAEIEATYQLTPQEYEGTLRRVHELSRRGGLHVRPICAPHYFRILSEEKDPSLKNSRHGSFHSLTKGCLAGTGIVFVSHDGNVFPCGYLPLSCGNVRAGTLNEIWGASDILRKLRNEESLEGKCGECDHKKICSGCRARAYQESGNFLGEEPNCLYVPPSSGPGRLAFDPPV